jgi:hypothetical protein
MPADQTHPAESVATAGWQAKPWRVVVWYSSLLIGLLGSVALFLLVWPDRVWLRLVALALAVFYVFWGSIVHKRAKAFSSRVFWEYVAVASFGTLMLWLVI